MPSIKFEYDAVKVEQRPGATPFYLLAVKASEILKWADVPRKKATYMAGYQRELDDRHKRISKFIELDPKNIIPGAVIVAVKSEVFTELRRSPGAGMRVRLEFEDRKYENLLSTVYDEFLSRLSEAERESISREPPETSSEELAEADEDDGSEPRSYIARLTAELGTALTAPESLPSERMSAVEEFVRGVTKPGLIIDGQHRVFGAKEVSDFDVVLPVVLLPGLPYEEQVFHFYVLNNKARPLRPTELRATISTSLTNKEIEELYARLRQSGVNAEEARWTHRMNTESSPFKGKVDFGFENGTGFIPENVAYQIASAFMKPAKKYRFLFKDVDAWNDADYRMKLFFRFWTTISERYPTAWSAARDGGGKQQIFMKATMICLQELVFDQLVRGMPGRTMKKEPSPFADPEDLAREVASILYWLPEEFFTRTWTETGLDTAERRRFLKDQMQEAINNQGEKLGYLTLFKAKATARK